MLQLFLWALLRFLYSTSRIALSNGKRDLSYLGMYSNGETI
jgi:hypothetical protein